MGLRVRVACPLWSCPPSLCFKCVGEMYTFLSGSVCLRLKYSVPCKLGITPLCETGNTSYRFSAGRDPVTKGRRIGGKRTGALLTCVSHVHADTLGSKQLAGALYCSQCSFLGKELWSPGPVRNTLRVSGGGIVRQDSCLATNEDGYSLSWTEASWSGLLLQVSLRAQSHVMLTFTSLGWGWWWVPL